MHTSLYDEVGSKYGLERGDSIEGRNVSHLSKRDYIRKLSKDAKQAEKAVKGLQTMIRKLEREMLADRNRLKEIDEALASGKITLDRYEEQKADIQKLIAEYQEKLVLLYSHFVTTRLISRHRKLQRKYHCSVRTNGLSVRIGLSPSSLPKLSGR